MAPPRSITVVHAGLSGAFDKTFPQISSSGTHNHQAMLSWPPHGNTPLTITSSCVLDHERCSQTRDRQRGSPCSDKAMLAQGVREDSPQEGAGGYCTMIVSLENLFFWSRPR